MKQHFPGYYQLAADDFVKLWQNAIFVFDSCVLLNLYRYPQQAREDLLSRIEQLSDRIWIPYHVALEYQRNRPSVIAEQKKRFREVRRVVDDSLKSLRTDLDGLQLKKRHSTIDVDGLLNVIHEKTKEFLLELESLETSQHDAHDV